MSYSRWGSAELGWYVYRDTNGLLYVSPGCPRDGKKDCPMHDKAEPGRACSKAEFLSRERVTALRDVLTDALDEWDAP